MVYISDFADQAVMLPLAILVCAALAMLGWWRGCLAWAVAVGGTFGLILVLKAGFMILTAEFGSDWRLSPSGHVAAACIVYGGLAMLVLGGTVPGALLAVVPTSVTMVIGYTRIGLGVHTVAEVAVGAAIGGMGVVVLGSLAGPRPRITFWPVTAAAGVVACLLHGWHIPAEEAIQFASTKW